MAYKTNLDTPNPSGTLKRRRIYPPGKVSTPAAVQPPSALTALVAATVPPVKQEDEFTLPEFVATARAIGRPISERAALNVLNKQVKLNLLATRRTNVDGHTAKVWRPIPK